MSKHPMHAEKLTVWGRARKWLAMIASGSLAVGMLVAGGVTAAHADLDDASLRIFKTVTVEGTEYDLPDAPNVGVGEEFQWTIQVICDQITDYCVNATLTDVIPDEFEIVTGGINTGAIPSNVDVTGQSVTVEFQEPLSQPDGAYGLSATGFVTIPVKLRAIPVERNGEIFTNTASAVADNAPEVSDDAAVTASVAFTLVAEASKEFDPAISLAEPGAPLSLEFGGANVSNGSVDTLVVQDPIDPTATPNIFQEYLQIDGLTSVTWPDGAETAVVSAHNGTDWVDAPPVAAPNTLALPGSVNTADIRGIRVTFTAANPEIPVNALTSVQLALSQRDSVSGITVDTELTNVSTAQVSVNEDVSSLDEAPANVMLRPAATSVKASKVFSPNEIAVSGATTQSTVTLGAENTGTRTLETLTITEPSDLANSHNDPNNLLSPEFPGGGVIFDGFGDVTWPTSTDEASITYHFADGTSETLSTTTLDTLPDPSDDTKRVTGFSVTFTGEIVEGAEATVPFTVDASETDGTDFPDRTITGKNEITVSGTTPGATPDPDPNTAEDELTIFAEQISIVTEKSLTHTELYAIPGQTTTARLKTTIQPYPHTTQNPTQVIIDDPASVTGVTDWYEHFDATAITLAQIPANATLTVQWRDAAGTFADIPGMTDLAGGQVYSAPIPAPPARDEVAGIRFIYESSDGFVPGQELVPNITFTTRSDHRTSGLPIPSNHPGGGDLDTPLFDLENCSASEASKAALDSGRAYAEDPCPRVELMPVGTGVGPGISKDWDPDMVFSHSRYGTTVNLGWSAGIQGLDEVIIGDVATDPANGNPAQMGAASVFDAFNLTRIGPINDPLFAFDQVQVQVYNATTSAWEDLSTCTEADPCSGDSIPAINLNTAQQQSTVAVRFLVTEDPDREPTNPGDPLPGTGVAVGDRTIPLTLQLRDNLRSDASHPVVEGPIYNTSNPSEVLNTTSIEGYVGGDREHRSTDSDTILIDDLVLAMSASKTWSDGPVAIPSDWGVQPPPTTRVALTTTNETAGVINPGNIPVGGRVSELRIDEPGHVDPGQEKSPFEQFDLVRFHSLTTPSGTDWIEFEFEGAGTLNFQTNHLSPSTAHAEAWAKLQSYTAEDLRPVTGIIISFHGNIVSGAANGTGGLEFDLELRQFERASGDPVTTADSPAQNTVRGTVGDKRWDGTGFVDEELGQDRDAEVQLLGGSLGVTSTKSFNPTFQTEPDNPEVTMTLGAQPSGTERAQSLVLTDDRATFWNGYDFKRVADSFTLPNFAPNANPLQLEISVCTGRDFDAADIDADPTLGCEATGGSWSDYTDPMPPAAAQGWAPANPENVEGIRVRIARETGVQWENPRNPQVNIPLIIERRDDLRSGGPVPSTLRDGEDSAPGQATKGVTVNSVGADLTGIWGGSAAHSSDAPIEYRHARNAVQVAKEPIGTKSPGVPFEYTLTVRNSGDRDIVDPVITDRLPWDDELGTMVQFDPDASPTLPRYGYTLSGTNPASDPMPTDPEDVTVTEDLGSTTPTIEFEFPAGTRLAPGQTYTITFKMMFVAGVQEGQPVTNSFDISGDRVWDACGLVPGTPSGDRTVSLLNGDTECSTTAQVTPQRLPSIRGVKSVRAVDPAGGYNNHGFIDAAACTNRVDGDDYAFHPCVPRSMPGQTEQWRLTITNNGTTPMNRVVVADYLPRPGDSTLIANFPRHSQWTPVLQDTVPTMSGVTGTIETYVTAAAKADICMAGINTPTDAQLNSCIDQAGGAAEAQTRFVPFTNLTAEDLEDATALLFVVDPTTPGDIPPGTVINIGFETKTGPFSVQDASDPQAFNSLTVSARYPDGSTERTLTSRDQSNVGIGLITGSLSISKSVGGPGASFMPDDQIFSGTLKCTSQGVDIPDRSFTVTVDSPTVISNLPAGAECTAVETAASGQTSYTATTVIVPDDRVTDPADLPDIEIANVYELTELVVSKDVLAPGGQLIPSGFGFTVSCTFLGQTIALDASDAEFTLDDGGSHTITGLPVNASCTITETDDRSADNVNVEAETLDENGDPWGAVTENNPGSNAVIAGLAPSTGSNTAAFTNTYGNSAQVRVEKSLVGGAADLAESLTFEVQVVCVFEGETIYDETLLLNAGNGWGTTVPPLVADAECTITESDLEGADAVLITPNDGTDTTVGIVTIPSTGTAPVAVDVTNRYLAGELTVTKAITGAGATLWGTGDFEVLLECTLDGDPVRVIDGAGRTLNAGEPTTTYVGIPSGAVCTISETDNAGATESQIQVGSDAPVPADPGASFTVVVDASNPSNDDIVLSPANLENRFDLAEVSLTKSVVTDAVDQQGTPIEYGPFEVELKCEFNGAPITVPGDAVKVLYNGDVVTWDQLPAGALCVTEEINTADADDVWYELPAADPLDPPVTVDGQVLDFAPLAPVGSTDTNEATLNNFFESTALTVAKTLSGDGASTAMNKTFQVELVCTLTDASHPDGAEVWNDIVSLSAANDWQREIPAIASGAVCQATEVETGDAARTKVLLDGVQIGALTAQFEASGASLTLTVDNTFILPLALTGGDLLAAALIGVLLLVLGVAALVMHLRRRRTISG